MSPAPIYNEFLNQTSWFYGGTSSRVKTIILSADTWEEMDLGSISYAPVSHMNKGNMRVEQSDFVSDSVGWYRCQFVFTFSGIIAGVYKIIAELNDIELDYTLTQFSTDGANYIEMQMGFIYHADYVGSSDKGLNSSVNRLSFKAQNVGAVGDLTLENATYTIIKID
jgi:hypothetical protein